MSSVFIPAREKPSTSGYPGLVRAAARPHDWFVEATEKLQNIASLNQNWDSYGASRPNSVSIYYAYELLRLIHNKVGITRPAITPAPNGNICFEWDEDHLSALLEIQPSGFTKYVFERDGVEEEGTCKFFTDVLQLLTML